MPQTRTRAIAISDYPTGEIALNETNLPNWCNRVTFELDRCTLLAPTIWPDPTTKIAVDLEISFDDGGTWTYAGGFGAFGGIHVRRDGTEAIISAGRISFQPGTRRRVRGKVTILNGPIRTGGTVQLDG